jgi:hypothetical protein
VRELGHHDRLRCSCGGWTPFGRPLSRERFTRLVTELRSFLDQAVNDYQWAEGLCHDVTRRGEAIRAAGPSDPTGSAIADGRRQEIRAWVVLTSRLLERTLADMRMVDDAIGTALWIADPVPLERVDGEWHETGQVVFPWVAEAREAKGRRVARGEGIP